MGNIEKGRLVQQQRLKIMEYYERKKYTEILQQLLTQAMCQLLEPALVLRCRQVDQQIVESVIPASVAEYKAKVNKDCQVKVDTDNWLPSDCTGGIEILAFKGKIKVDNTLEARLNMISQQILPEVRNKLFGANPSRKFTD